MANYNVGDVIQLPKDDVIPGHDRAKIEAVFDDDYPPSYRVTCTCGHRTKILSQRYVDSTTLLVE